MGSEEQSKLPFVELKEANLTPGTSCWKSTSDYVRQALETYGCLVVSYEKSQSEAVRNDMFTLTSEELFGLPPETKVKHTNPFAGFGYGGNFSTMPLFEYFGIQDAETLEGAEQFSTLMWPNGHNKFSETLYSYCQLLLELHHAVMKMVIGSYGLDKYYDPLIQSSFYMTRIMKYNAPGKNESRIGIVPHRDKSFMTVIGTNEVKGLQIETPDGEWIDFEPSPSKFIVVVGEAMMAWSNGRLYCPLHKVVARGTEEKYSVGIFSFIRGILQVPEELVDDEHPLKFKSFSNLEFLESCREGGQCMRSAIHAYCGI
jgi:isopenicillin N synthase-like dioxygenase